VSSCELRVVKDSVWVCACVLERMPEPCDVYFYIVWQSVFLCVCVCVCVCAHQHGSTGTDNVLKRSLAGLSPDKPLDLWSHTHSSQEHTYQLKLLFTKSHTWTHSIWQSLWKQWSIEHYAWSMKHAHTHTHVWNVGGLVCSLSRRNKILFDNVKRWKSPKQS